jgi:hypothetical protein
MQHNKGENGYLSNIAAAKGTDSRKARFFVRTTTSIR